MTGGEPCSPRQVVAGIPLPLSDLTSRALRLRDDEAGDPLLTPADFASALLATLPPPAPPAALAAPSWREHSQRTQQGGWRPEPQRGEAAARAEAEWAAAGLADTDWPGRGDAGSAQDWRDAPGGSRHGARTARRALRRPGLLPVPSGMARVAVIAACVVVLAAIAAFTLWPGSGTPPGQPRPGRSTPLTSATTLSPTLATGFDPLTSVASDPGNEDTQAAHFAIDGNPKTDWTSQWYASADFGHLKAGSGLLIDMGRTVRFSTVTVTLGSEPGAQVKLLAGASSARSKQNLESMTTIASANSPTGTYTFHLTSNASGRYLVIWFTVLPPEPGASGKYEAQVYDVTVKGTPAS